LGNYVILDKLGQGGMGLVLKAEHRRMERLVALKILSPNVIKTPEALQRFQREVKAAARLTHPNIVIAYDADEADATHFFVMEYVDGNDLSTLVKKQGAPAARSGAALHPAGGPWAAIRSRAWCDPPRCQTLEPASRRGRNGQDPRYGLGPSRIGW
jgi:serine/threonine protein kinase